MAALLLAAASALSEPAVAGDAVTGSAMREPISVTLDQAKVVKLPERTATLVVGNPLIADASVQPGGVAVITAKSHGVTNLVALDRAGAALVEYPVQVLGPSDNLVVVYRGIERESYSCVTTCERRITLGDSATYFTMTLNQTNVLNTLAQGPR
jgi:Flp pilus assembly secretin CpaC